MYKTLAAATVAVVALSGASYAQEAPGADGLANKDFVTVNENARFLNKDRVVTSSTAGYSVQAEQAEPRFRWNEN